jgi:hypothetical protein
MSLKFFLGDSESTLVSDPPQDMINSERSAGAFGNGQVMRRVDIHPTKPCKTARLELHQRNWL